MPCGLPHLNSRGVAALESVLALVIFLGIAAAAFELVRSAYKGLQTEKAAIFAHAAIARSGRDSSEEVTELCSTLFFSASDDVSLEVMPGRVRVTCQFVPLTLAGFDFTKIQTVSTFPPE